MARTLRELVARTTDRVPAKDRAVVLEFIEANEPDKALEHLALRLVEDDQPVSKDEGLEMEELDRVLQPSRRGAGAVSFAAAGLSGPFR